MNEALEIYPEESPKSNICWHTCPTGRVRYFHVIESDDRCNCLTFRECDTHWQLRRTGQRLLFPVACMKVNTTGQKVALSGR
jgi:hypothetical protein